MACDLNELMIEAACFDCLSDGQKEALILQLLCEIKDQGLV